MTASPTRPGRRLSRRVRAAAAVASGALVLVCAPVVTGGGLGVADAAPVTVTGTVSGDHAWNPATNSQFPDTPSVTVDQVDDLTDQVVHVTWQHFTPTLNNAGNFFSSGSTNYAVTVLQCKGTDPVAPTSWSWPDFGADCYNHTPDDATAEHGVGNEAYTITGANGSGEAYFHVETSQQNDFLGCSATVPCSLVVVPNWGGKQPVNTAPGGRGVDCSNHRGDTSFIQGHYALDTNIGGACSWADRIVVPLSFAPTPQNCAAKDFAFASAGSPMMSRTMLQWQSGWCAGSKGLTFDYDSGTNEYLARQSFLAGSGALTSATDVALVNRPATGADAAKRKFTYAPLTNSAITVAYHVDNQQTGRLFDDLTLNARLVAKLVTQSYSLDFGCLAGGDTTQQSASCDPAVKGNPADIFDDPEFQALNPQYPRTDFPAVSLLNRGQFLPLVISGNSDVTYELTRWLESDANARAFLSGSPDPAGMHVNTYYKNQTLPLDQFQVLDPGYTAPASDGVPGMSTMQVTWNPLTGFTNVSSSLVIDRPSAINPTLPACGTAGVPCVYQRFGAQAPGNRALFAIVGLADAAADRFQTAKLVNAGSAAVAPTTTSLAAAVSHMKTNPDGTTRAADFTNKDAAQYPLTVTEYAMVPTCGLKADQASAVRDFLTRVTTSQQGGLQPGQLAPGNLALTGAQLTETRASSSAVTSNACPKSGGGSSSSPPATSGGSTSSGSGTTSGGGNGNSGGGTGGNGGGGNGAGNGFGGVGGGTGGGLGGGTSGSASPSGSAAPSSSGSPAASAAPSASLAAYGIKHDDSNANPALLLPILLVVFAAMIVGGPGAYLYLSTGAGQALRRRLRGVRR